MTATHTHTHPFNGPFSRTTRVSQYQKGKTNLDFTEARDSEWPWHQLGHMQVCTSLQTDNHASTPPLSFYRPGALLPPNQQHQSTEGLTANAIYSPTQLRTIRRTKNEYKAKCSYALQLRSNSRVKWILQNPNLLQTKAEYCDLSSRPQLTPVTSINQRSTQLHQQQYGNCKFCLQ